MTLNLSSDIKRYANEYLDTKIFENDIPYYLPISCLENKDFALGYDNKQSIVQEGVTARTSGADKIGLDNFRKK